MAIPQFESFTRQYAGANAASGTVAAAPGIQENDLVLLFVYAEGLGQTVTSAGFTRLDPAPEASNHAHAVLWKIAGASEPTEYTASWSASDWWEVACARISGVDTSTPIEGYAQAVGGSSTSTPAVSVTSEGSDRLLVWSATDHLNFSGSASWTAPTGWTLEGGAQLVGVASLDQPAAGTVAGIVGQSVGFGASCATVFAVRPPGGEPEPVVVSGTAAATLGALSATAIGAVSGGGGGEVGGVRARLTGTGGESATHNVTLPSETQVGDRLVVGFVNDYAERMTATASVGWDLLGTAAEGTTTNHRLSVWTRVATGSDALTVTLNDTDPVPDHAQEAAWVSICLVGDGAPLGGQAAMAEGGNAQIGTITPFQSLDAGDYVSIVFLGLDNNGEPGHTVTPPTDWTNLTTPGTNTPAVLAFSMDRTVTVSTGGSIDPQSVTWTTDDQWATAHVVVPAAAGTPGAPIVDAGPDAAVEVGEEFQRIATVDDNGSPLTSIGWEIISGPSGVGDTNASTGFGITPPAAGTYVLQFHATNAVGTSTDSLNLTATEAPGDLVRLPADPGEALWIGHGSGSNHFNIGIGATDANSGESDSDHNDYSETQIGGGFTEANRFFLNEDGNVVMRIGANDGRTSENTEHPRTELREFDESGNEADWDASSGLHRMWGTTWITHVAHERPWICFFQIHDASSDMIRIQTDGDPGQTTNLDVVARYERPGDSGEQGPVTLMSGYDVGDRIDWEIEVQNGTCRIWLNGTVVFNLPGFTSSGCYFKSGCYLQTNTTKENGDSSQYGELVMEAGSFGHSHTGWAENTEPVFTGELVASTHRFYLTSLAADWGPQVALSFWDAGTVDAGTDNPLRLGTAPAGASGSTPLTETSSSDAFNGLVRQWVSHPASAAGTLTGVWQTVVGCQSTDVDASLAATLGVWVSVGDSATVRGGAGAVGNFSSDAMPETATMDLFGNPSPLVNEVVFEAGDRIVVEFGVHAGNTDPTPVEGRIYFGGTATPDPVGGETDMTRPGWLALQTTPGVSFEAPPAGQGTATAVLGALSATAAGVATSIVSGTASSVLGVLTASASGEVSQVHVAAVLGPLAASAAGVVTTPSRGDAELGGLAATAAGVRETFGSGDADLGFAATSTGVRTTFGQASAPLGGLTARIAADTDRPDVILSGALPHVAFWMVDPATDALSPLPHVLNFELSPVRNGFGSVRLDYPRNGINYGLLRAMVDDDIQPEIEIWVGGTPTSRKRAILMEAEGDDATDASVWTFAGHFLEYLTHDAVLAPNPTPGDDWKTWFDNESPGTVIATLMQAAQARGTLTGLTFDTFTDTLDSNGVAWSQVVNLELAPHRFYDEILTDLADMGVIEWEVSAEHELRLYEPGSRGIDRTEGVPTIVRAGKGLREAQRKFSSRDAGTDLWAAGGDGFYDNFGDATARARFGRQIERTDSQNYIIDEGALDAYIQNKIGTITAGAMELTVGIEFGADKPQPVAGFDVGDWIWIDAGQGTLDRAPLERYRVAQWTLNGDGDELTGTISVNDLMAERISRLEKLVRGVSGGAVVVGTSLPEADNKAPAAPDGVSASSLAYIDEQGLTMAAINVAWSEVVTNADGTALFDMSGYRVRFRYLTLGPTGYQDAGRVSSIINNHDFSGVISGATIGVQVQAYDRTGLDSEWSDEFQLIAAADATPPPVPSTPTVSNYIGLIRVDWDGLGAVGEPMPVDFQQVEILASEVDDFDPATDPHQIVGTLRAEGSYPWSPPDALGNPDYGTTWFVKLRSVDLTGNTSATSGQGSAVPGRVADGDIAEVSIGKLTAGIMTALMTISGLIRTAETGARVEIDNDGIRILDGADNELLLFDATTETLTISGEVIVGEGIGQGRTIAVEPNNNDPEINFYPSAGAQRIRWRGIMSPPPGGGASEPGFWMETLNSGGDNEGPYIAAAQNTFWLGYREGTTYEGGTLKLSPEGSGTGATLDSGSGEFQLVKSNGASVRSAASDLYMMNATSTAGVQAFGDGELWFVDSGSQFRAKSFVIPHPTDGDRWLVHGCTESPWAGVEYWGEAEIVGGRAVVPLPGYFEALTETDNRNIQVTPVGELCMVAADPIADGRFTIRCSGPDGTRINWLVKAARRDVDFEVEPRRDDVVVSGFGPYRTITPREPR